MAPLAVGEMSVCCFRSTANQSSIEFEQDLDLNPVLWSWKGELHLHPVRELQPCTGSCKSFPHPSGAQGDVQSKNDSRMVCRTKFLLDGLCVSSSE